MEQRISWAWTHATYRVLPAISYSLCAVFGLWWAWESVRSKAWTQAGMGVLAAVLCCELMRRVRGLYDVWIRDRVLILRRGQTQLEVPLDRVTSVYVSVRAVFARGVSVYWTDDSGVERRARFAVTDSPAWLALLRRLTRRVPPVRFLS